MISLLIGVGAGVGVMLIILFAVNGGLPIYFLKPGPFVLSETVDGRGMKLKNVENTKSGTWTTDDAEYLGTEGGTNSLKGTNIAISTENSGINQPLRFAAYTQWLKQQHDIHDIDELENVVLKEAINQNAIDKDVEWEAAKSDAFKKSAGNLEFDDINFEDLELGIGDVDPEQLEGFDMQVPIFSDEAPQPPVEFKHFRRFMKHNLNPSKIKADKDRVKANLKEELSGFSIDMGTGIAIFLMLLGVAAVLMFAL